MSCRRSPTREDLMRTRLLPTAVAATVVALMLACNGGQKSPSAPSAVSESTTAGGLQNAFQTTTSWSCFSGGATARILSSTNDWSVDSEPCTSSIGGAVRNTPAAASEPIFAPGPSNFRATITGTTVLLQWD